MTTDDRIEERSAPEPVADALLPCPFCGGEATVEIERRKNGRSLPVYEYYRVGCGTCSVWFGGEDKAAVAAWNHRTLPPVASPAADPARVRLADLIASCEAVLHQLEHGEASGGDRKDVAWCAAELRRAIEEARRAAGTAGGATP